jgi:hypothetical protein
MPGLLDYFNRGTDALAGSTGNYGGLLSEEDQKAAQQQARMALAAQLLDAGGYSQQRVGLGQALGRGMGAASQARQGSVDQSLQSVLLKKQLASLDQKEKGPSSVQEYEYAKTNGFEGSFQDWIVAGGQNSRPSSVQEWEHYSGLMAEDKKNGTNKAQLYLEMKRNPTFDFRSVAGVPTMIAPSHVGGTNTTALSTLGQETAAAGALKQAEAQGGAVGKGSGEIKAGIEKKGSDAVSVKSVIQQAREAIPKATGSTGGAALDSFYALSGKATEGAKAIAKLRVLQANLMMNQPRMEGPQGEKDVELYQQAAGQIGDPNVPREIKLEALNTIEEINNRYEARASGATSAAPKSETKRRRYNPATGKIE